MSIGKTALVRGAVGRAARFAGIVAWLLITFASVSRASTQPGSRQAPVPSSYPFTIADFDGDHRPDIASVRAGGNGNNKVLYLIEVRLSGGQRQTIGLTASAGGLQLWSRDVNGDDIADLVVTTSLTDEPVAVFLNDGQGNFRRTDPAAYPEAFRKSNFSLAAQTNCDNDRIGADLSRPLPEGGRLAVTLWLPANPSGPWSAALFSAHREPTSGAWFGRAPPR